MGGEQDVHPYALEQEIVSALRRIVRAIDVHSRRLAEDTGLTGPQLVTLREAARIGAVPTGVLSRAVHLSQPTVTGIVARLEQRGLLQRVRGAGDRRQSLVELTEEGREVLAEAPSLLQDRFRDRLSRLESWEHTQILSTLQRIAGMMDAEHLDAAPMLTAERLGANQEPPAMVEEEGPSEIVLRSPELSDGAALWRLAGETGVLERNSAYAYLLVGSHFRRTSVVAERSGELVGFVAAYRPPTHPEAVFVWQVGVHPAAQRSGLGLRLLRRAAAKGAGEGARYLEASVTPSNSASQSLFRALARSLDTRCVETPWLSSDHFPEGSHEAEHLFSIGPFGRHSDKREEKSRKSWKQ